MTQFEEGKKERTRKHQLCDDHFSLRNRKKQWRKEEQERIANNPDPSMPPGHRALPEHERRETLILLQNS